MPNGLETEINGLEIVGIGLSGEVLSQKYGFLTCVQIPTDWKQIGNECLTDDWFL